MCRVTKSNKPIKIFDDNYQTHLMVVEISQGYQSNSGDGDYATF